MYPPPISKTHAEDAPEGEPDAKRSKKALMLSCRRPRRPPDFFSLPVELLYNEILEYVDTHAEIAAVYALGKRYAALSPMLMEPAEAEDWSCGAYVALAYKPAIARGR